MDLGVFPLSRGRATFSGRPNDDIYEAVRGNGTDLWWNLARELPDAVTRMAEAATKVRYLPLRDYHVPEGPVADTFRTQLGDALAILSEDGLVHVSCFGGHGRTGLALACLAIALEDGDPEEALRRAHEACGGPETDEQREFVRSFARERPKLCSTKRYVLSRSRIRT